MEAVKEGVPAIAFFDGTATTEVSFTTLTTQPNTTNTKAFLLNADLTTMFTATLFNSGSPFLLPDLVLAVNYPSIAGCPAVSDYKFVLAKYTTTKTTTVQICGRAELPLASTVLATKGCFASVTVLDANKLTDVVSVADQQDVVNRLGSLLSCLP